MTEQRLPYWQTATVWGSLSDEHAAPSAWSVGISVLISLLLGYSLVHQASRLCVSVDFDSILGSVGKELLCHNSSVVESSFAYSYHRYLTDACLGHSNAVISSLTITSTTTTTATN